MQTMFRKFGVMLDCSRNAVMTVPALKKFIELLSRMGYNQLQLYMEDTYEVEGEPQFGYLRGRYSMEELKELDDFAFSVGVELVPNIQTLAHLNAFLRWRRDLVDTGDILLVGDEKVYALIEKMFASLRKCFRTKQIHIGMDEAHMLGRGKYQDLHGYENRFDILCGHLQKVRDLAKKYGFEPMMWSDMFYRLANGGAYYKTDSTFDPSVREKIPEDVTLVYWDYYSHDEKRYNAMLKGHRLLSDNLAFAGGAWTWSGFAPHNWFSVKANRVAFRACQKHGVKDVFLTMWGDNGAECSAFSVLPALCSAACAAQGITRQSEVREKFEQWVGLRYEDFMLLDLPNNVVESDVVVCPSKYFLYADCFASIFQNLERAEYAEKYASYVRRLRNAAKRNGAYAHLFTTLAELCGVLQLKQDICTRTRQAYESGDKAALDAVIADYRKMLKRTETFYRAFRTQWYLERKPHGFDVQDARLGGLQQRMKSCLERLEDYRAGRIPSIPELEETIVPFTEQHLRLYAWSYAITGNVV